MSDELVDLVTEEATDGMQQAVDHVRGDLAGVRTGRASPALIEKMPVEVYGAEVPLQQVASISVPEARLLVISPFDKDTVTPIEKAIQRSDLGLSPSNDGIVIRLSFPPLTAERRKELVRVVKQMAEDGRVGIRNHRRAARQELERMQKDGDLGEDDVGRAEKTIDGHTHRFEALVDEILAAKEKELMEE
jgi:ribosome recycling factor